jgi:2-polyprenyl-3-methyl-5-hydroxy-6-metoxy-1,4-benzoquinol methylase
MGAVVDDAWEQLADPFVDGAYATVKGRVRTHVLHQQLLRHLPPTPAAVLDVGGGAGHQSLPLARLGYDVTILDPSAALLAKAEERVAQEPHDVRSRIGLVQAAGESAVEVTDGRQFSAVLCHGVLMYLASTEPLIDVLCRCVEPGGVVSVMTLNAATMAVRPALEHRWDDALAGLDANGEIGVLGTQTHGETVEHVSKRLSHNGIETTAWYGVWLFSDWMDLPVATTDVDAVAQLELEASLRDPYRQLSRAFHLVGTRHA